MMDMDEQSWVVWFMNEHGWFPTFEGTRDEAEAYLDELRKRGKMADLEQTYRDMRQQAIEAVHHARQRLDNATTIDMIDACVLELRAAEKRLRAFTKSEAKRDPEDVRQAENLLGRMWFKPRRQEHIEHCDTCGRPLDQMRGEDFFVEDKDGSHVYCEAHWPDRGETA